MQLRISTCMSAPATGSSRPSPLPVAAWRPRPPRACRSRGPCRPSWPPDPPPSAVGQPAAGLYLWRHVWRFCPRWVGDRTLTSLLLSLAIFSKRGGGTQQCETCTTIDRAEMELVVIGNLSNKLMNYMFRLPLQSTYTTYPTLLFLYTGSVGFWGRTMSGFMEIPRKCRH